MRYYRYYSLYKNRLVESAPSMFKRSEEIMIKRSEHGGDSSIDCINYDREHFTFPICRTPNNHLKAKKVNKLGKMV